MSEQLPEVIGTWRRRRGRKKCYFSPSLIGADTDGFVGREELLFARRRSICPPAARYARRVAAMSCAAIGLQKRFMVACVLHQVEAFLHGDPNHAKAKKGYDGPV